ncbi:MAG: putative YigZ family protein [Saprospiraceae bacterium]|jgi:uncharacterized YigZ family protein
MTKLIKDTYQILSAPSEGEYKEKGSKFLAYAYPVRSIEDVEYYQSEVKDMHPKARHFCYAYRIGIEGDIYRTNDDGEPSGTAGKPIYGQFLSHNVSDVLIIVVRYFGGTKLGASGLIHAYKTSAHEALEIGEKINRVLSDIYRLTFEYGEMGHVLNVTKSLDLNITNKVFEAVPFIEIEVPRGKIDQSLINLKAKLLQISTEQITDKTTIPFCKIDKIERDD